MNHLPAPTEWLVLVVEDSLTVRMDLLAGFDEAGQSALGCATLAEARQKLGSLPIGLLVLDVQLPDGDGLGLLREVRTTPGIAALPIIVLSAERELEDRIRGMNAGASLYAGKPYDRSFVVQRGRDLLRQWVQQNKRRRDKNLILVIEDSPTFAHELQPHLEKAGYEVLLATTGKEGLRAAALMRPDGIIVDGQLPDCSGISIVSQFRQDPALKLTPCILYTASLHEEVEAAALEGGADVFLQKNRGFTEMLARLSTLLRARGRNSVMLDMPSALAKRALILCVEDSETYLGPLQEALTEANLEPIVARSAEEGLAVLENQSVDAILLDLGLPGMSGAELCARLRESPSWQDLPILILTASEDQALMLDALTLGADDFIVKSDDFSIVRARVQVQLRRRLYEGENRRLYNELHRIQLSSARELAQARAELLSQLEAANQELARSNEELQRSNFELQQFVYVASHDLAEPARTVANFCQLIKREYASVLDERGLEWADYIVQGAQRMRALLSNLSEYAQSNNRPMTLEWVELGSVVESALSNLQKTIDDADASIKVGELPSVAGDAIQLTQLFQNLISNAVKFRAKERQPEVQIEARSEGDQWLIVVRDNGIGIDPQHREQVFRIFRRLHSKEQYAGTGIGLSICRTVAERHGGSIEVLAAPQHGAEFLVRLPSRSPPSPGTQYGRNELREPLSDGGGDITER